MVKYSQSYCREIALGQLKYTTYQLKFNTLSPVIAVGCSVLEFSSGSPFCLCTFILFIPVGSAQIPPRKPAWSS